MRAELLWRRGTISQLSWTDGTSLDQYYWLEHSFNYAANINTDDELHWIKLSQKVSKTSDYANCQLVSVWNNGVMALPLQGWAPKLFKFNGSSFSNVWTWSTPTSWIDVVAWTVFQDYFWYWASVWGNIWLAKVPVVWWSTEAYVPYDHPEATDDSIMDKDNVTVPMTWAITAILNYNNTRLVVAAGTEIWVYYPELDVTEWQEGKGKTWWKKVMDYEAWVYIVWLTCTFEYLKVWAVDEWWNTKVYYYQGNNNLRDTFVYNVIDLTGEKVLRVYSINSVDYYITTMDGTDWYVNFNKMIGNVPVQILKQRAGLTSLDINTKDPYFVWPCWLDAPYQNGAFYVADAYWIFKFNYTANSYDKWYMKWKLRDNPAWKDQVSWVCINQNFLLVSDNTGCWGVRIYDTWVDGYQESWILISREIEWEYGSTLTKILEEVRLWYEMNPNTTGNWTIDVYVSPNNLWTSTNPIWDGSDGWYHVLHISELNALTRTEEANAINNYIDDLPSSFAFDWQTITYAIKITRGSESRATPIVREITMEYKTKAKVNNVFNIKN